MYETMLLGFSFLFEGGLISVFAKGGVDINGVFHDDGVIIVITVIVVSGFGKRGGAIVVVKVEVVNAMVVVIVPGQGGWNVSRRGG